MSVTFLKFLSTNSSPISGCFLSLSRRYDVSKYAGQAGDQINIRAVDDFRVERVRLTIRDSTDSTIEEGEAILSANGADWVYTATAGKVNLTGTELIMSAADVPGNITTKEVIL